MGICCQCNKQKKNNNISNQQGERIQQQQQQQQQQSNQQQQIIVEQQQYVQQELIDQQNEEKPTQVNQEEILPIQVLPGSPLIKKSQQIQLDIREVDLLKMSFIELFEQKIEEIEREQAQFNNSKQSIETQLIQSFISDENLLVGPSEFMGVRVKNRNICDIENKYDFSQVQEFTECNDKIITIVRLIQKQKSSICTYLGKIDEKYCCVKLIPMAKRIHIDKWITKVKIAQQTDHDTIFNNFFQKYCYYKIETIRHQEEYCNCFIICNLEQFNLYTFSHHPSVTLTEKTQIAPDIIQLIWYAFKQNKPDDKSQKISDQIFRTIKTMKRNNILISKQQGQLKIIFSDWQLLLPEFEQIIPNVKLQNEDKFCQEVFQQINIQIDLTSNSQKINEDILAFKLSQYFMKLLFFKSNFDLCDQLSLDGFFNKNEFESKCQQLVSTQSDQLLQEQIEQQIQNQQQTEYEPEKIEFINRKSQELYNIFQINPNQNIRSLYEIYLIMIVKKMQCEIMRTNLINQTQAIQNNNIHQNILQNQ